MNLESLRRKVSQSRKHCAKFHPDACNADGMTHGSLLQFNKTIALDHMGEVHVCRWLSGTGAEPSHWVCVEVADDGTVVQKTKCVNLDDVLAYLHNHKCHSITLLRSSR